MTKALFAFLLFLFAPAVFAGERVTVSLAESAGYTRRHNPDLAAARLRIAEAEGRLLGAGRLSNPEIGVELRSDRWGRENNASISFAQQFPLTARLRLEKALSRQLVKAAALEVREQERLTIFETQALLVKLLSLDEQRALRERQIELAQKLAGFVSGRASKGEISPLDAAQAQVDTQRLRLEVRKLEAGRVGLLGELKPKLGVAAAADLLISGKLPLPLMPAGASWEGRPDFQLARAKESAALTDVDLARANQWSDIATGVFWESERADGQWGLERTDFLGLRVSLPLPFWNKNQGGIAEKRAAASRAALETRALANGISNQVAAAWAEMAANVRLATETRNTLLPLVTEQIKMLEEAYAAGQADLVTVLRTRDQQLQLEAAELEATRDFHLARIRYEAATARHASAPASPER